ncbi:hypothetical protein [Streptomyces phaeoluteigriseus]|nr:hypothetical protein [Streptomyces phaeoluteigriseus]
MTVGRKACVLTDEERPALLTLVAVHQEAATASFDVTVWEK